LISVSIGSLHRENGEFRTEKLAIVAVQTVVGLDHRGVVPLGIVSLGKFQNFPRTIFDAISATLASIRDDMDFAPSDLNFFRIQWNPPVFHRPFLENICLRRKKFGKDRKSL
jgi:hypothetical protein